MGLNTSAQVVRELSDPADLELSDRVVQEDSDRADQEDSDRADLNTSALAVRDLPDPVVRELSGQVAWREWAHEATVVPKPTAKAVSVRVAGVDLVVPKGSAPWDKGASDPAAPHLSDRVELAALAVREGSVPVVLVVPKE